ncbi:MAG: 30S ribosomal protein S2, partial [Actinobacteria bacterium]|nr:30S ribosomal protein S2 [Actinomycetota bacterium]
MREDDTQSGSPAQHRRGLAGEIREAEEALERKAEEEVKREAEEVREAEEEP